MLSEIARSDARIVREVLSGKHDAFSTLVERYLPAIHALAFSQTGNHSDADDVAQESFLKAYRSLDSLREPRKFGSWLATIAKNTARSFMRDRAQRAEVALDESTPAAESDDMETRDLRVLLKGQIERLDEPQREVLLLHYFAGMSAREIGILLGLSKYAVQKRLQRARDVLGRRMVDLLGAEAMPRPAAKTRAKQIAGAAIATPVTWNVSAQAAAASALSLSVTKIVFGLAIVAAVTSGVWLVRHYFLNETASPEQRAWFEEQSALQDNPPTQDSGSTPTADTSTTENATSGGISGVVVNATTGKGMAIFTVVITAPDVRGEERITTDSTGAFRKSGLPAGSYSIFPDRCAYVLVGGEPRFARRGRFHTPVVEFSIRAGAPNQEMRLEVAKGASVSGRVYDKATRNPLPNIIVYDMTHEGEVSTSFGTHSRTAPDGSYRVEGLPVREYEIACDWEHLYSTRGHGVPIHVSELGETIEGIDIALDYGVTVTGRVIDQAGQPVEGATVTGRWRTANDLKSAIIDETAKDGSFIMGGAGFRPGGRFYIQATKGPDISPIEGPMDIPEGGLQDVVLTIARGASISGTLRNASGEPVAHTRIDAWYEPDKQSGFEDIDGRGFHRGDFGYGKNVKTAPDGSYLVEGLNPGKYGLQATAPGETQPDFLNMDILKRITIVRGESVTGVALILGKPENQGLVISGRVTDAAGSPIDGAKVRAYDQEGKAISTQTDGSGEFRLTGLLGDLYRIETEHAGFSSASQDAIAAGSQEVKIVLSTPGAIAGRVINAETGTPVQDFELLLTRGRSPLPDGQREPVKVAASVDGSFLLDDLDTGDWTLFVRAKGFTMARNYVDDLQPGQSTDDLIVRLEPAQPIAGIVVDGNGQPVRNAQIFLDHIRLDFVRSGIPLEKEPGARTDQNGEFLIDTLTPDARWLIVCHDSFAPNFEAIPPLGQNRTGMRIVLNQGGKVEGTITTAMESGNTDSPRFSVRARYAGYPEESPLGPIDIPCEPDGTYSYDRLPPGLLELTASLTYGLPVHGPAQSLRRTVTIKEGGTSTEDFVFQQYNAVLEGTVTGEGRPVYRARVRAEFMNADGDSVLFYAAADDKGHYRFDGLPSGTLKVTAFAVIQDGEGVAKELERRDNQRRGDPPRYHSMTVSACTTARYGRTSTPKLSGRPRSTERTNRPKCCFRWRTSSTTAYEVTATALAMGLESASYHRPLVITGSIFTAGQARQLLVERYGAAPLKS